MRLDLTIRVRRCGMMSFNMLLLIYGECSEHSILKQDFMPKCAKNHEKIEEMKK